MAVKRNGLQVLIVLSVSIVLFTKPVSAFSHPACISNGPHVAYSDPIVSQDEDDDPAPTNTPDANGIIKYKIKVGDSAWNIAVEYGMDLEDLYALNNIDEDTVLYVGDELIIRPGITPTPSLTPAPTKPVPTVTPTSKTDTAAPIATTAPTATATRVALVQAGVAGNGVMGLIISGFGISAVLITLCATFCIRNKRVK